MLRIMGLCLCLAAVPLPGADRDQPMLPDLAGESNWGMVTQEGRKLEINGHKEWTATGEIRDDGTVLLEWIKVKDGRYCPGVYKVEGRDLQGMWGYQGEIHFDEAGAIQGVLYKDRTYKVKQGQPPLPVPGVDDDDD